MFTDPDDPKHAIAEASPPAERLSPIAELHRQSVSEHLTIADLHRRWTRLGDEIERIRSEVDRVMMAREQMTWPMMMGEEAGFLPECISAELEALRHVDASADALARDDELRRRLADIEANPARYAPLQEAARSAFAAREAKFYAKAERHGLRIDDKRAAEKEFAVVEKMIWHTPIETIADIAALIDIALERDLALSSSSGVDDVWGEWPWLCLLTRRLHAHAPGVEFAWLRRQSILSRDAVADVLATTVPFTDPETTKPGGEGDGPSPVETSESRGDAAIRALFRQWQEQDAIVNAPGDDDCDDQETDRLCAIEREIYDMPCGAVGNSIKLFLLAGNSLASHTGGKLHPPAGPGYEIGYDMHGRLGLEYLAFRGLLRDAARLVPELAPLVAGVIDAPLTLEE
jgi:hypothetical protein